MSDLKIAKYVNRLHESWRNFGHEEHGFYVSFHGDCINIMIEVSNYPEDTKRLDRKITYKEIELIPEYDNNSLQDMFIAGMCSALGV